MIAGFGAAICVAGYAIYRYRERAKWAEIRKEQVEKLKQLKRLRWLKKRIATAGARHNLGK